MFQTKKLMIAAAFGLAGLMAIPAAAQYQDRDDYGWHRRDRDRDHDHDRDRDRRNNGYYNNGYYGGQNGYYSDSQNKAYQQGYKDGVWDNQHGPQNRNRYWKNPGDAQAYRDGYNAAYRGAYNGQYGNRNGRGRRGDGDADDYGYGGAYGNGGYYGGRYGYGYSQQGYIDGTNDGAHDRQTGHSYRPTEWPGYKHADRGYNGQMSKDQYKQAYRQAYLQGYQRGYYGRR